MHFVTKVWNLDGQDVLSDVISTVVEIALMHKTRHPMLVGTTSGEQRSPEYLTEASIPHQVEYMFFSTVAYNKP
jgi:preprotein translocase subunit SecA